MFLLSLLLLTRLLPMFYNVSEFPLLLLASLLNVAGFSTAVIISGVTDATLTLNPDYS
jgi:hypothetical protein